MGYCQKYGLLSEVEVTVGSRGYNEISARFEYSAQSIIYKVKKSMLLKIPNTAFDA